MGAFVGRQRMLASLREDVAAARRAGGGVVLVSGAAGVGKTRLVQELGLPARLFDDLHEAAPSRLAAFAAAVRTGEAVVAAFRPPPLAHPLVACLARLRERVQARVELGPLDEPDTARLVAALGGGPYGPRVFRLTGGNPFLVTELVRHGGEGIPPAVREWVGARVATLGPDAQRVVTTACVFAEPADVAALETLSGLGEDAVLDALDEAEAAGLLVPAPPDAYRFPQELVRLALYEELSPSRRARLHRRAVVVLESLPDDRAAELAIQYFHSAALPGAVNGVPHALAAARAREGEERERFLAIAAALARDADESVRAEIRAERAATARAGGLTPRELEVLRLLAGGRTTKEIAVALVVSPYTVDRHVANIYAKIGTHNRAAATAWAYAAGVV